ncbi:MAG: PP2C family protein-serine/threonine phosphatase, partial [Thermoanaerobaculia bacterium]
VGIATGEPYCALDDGQPTLVGTASRGSAAVLTFVEPPVGQQLAGQSGVWTQILPRAELDQGKVIDVRLGKTSVTLGLRPPRSGEEEASARYAFFGLPGEGRRTLTWWSRRPLLWWGQLGSPLRRLADGSELSPAVAVYLNGSLRSIAQRLFAGSPELNTRVWAGMIAVTGLLTTIYALALLMAAYMILGLSRAVNRLSRATTAVRAGDFSVRIPVRRRDQLGELQRSFNAMTGHLESLVATAAQKELLEKELAIARELQQSLLPVSLPASERVEFATLFEPSAAIGGDYYDILPIDADRLAVVIADVAGHGLPTGLRMAMIKSALAILVQDGKPPAEILARLDLMVRGQGPSRTFVTATLAVVDFRRCTLELTNAGHPPTYLVRGGEVEEILLPGSPLGGIGGGFGHRELALVPGDLVVWLSDGLIETANPQGEPFGYSRVREALEGTNGTAAEARDRLVAAVALHADHTASADDRTLVAMAYVPSASATVATPRNE